MVENWHLILNSKPAQDLRVVKEITGIPLNRLIEQAIANFVSCLPSGVIDSRICCSGRVFIGELRDER